MKDIILIFVLVLVVGSALFYIYRAKKKGKKCIGCPDASTCFSAENSSCACNCSQCSSKESCKK